MGFGKRRPTDHSLNSTIHPRTTHDRTMGAKKAAHPPRDPVRMILTVGCRSRRGGGSRSSMADDRPTGRSTPRIPHTQPGFQERLIGGLCLGSLIHIWVAGVFVVPSALYLALAKADYRLACLLGIYYAIRIVFPTKEWAFIRR